MATEQPSQETEERFDESLNEATLLAAECFDWMGLPEGRQRSELLYRLNDAIGAIMRDWL